MSDDNVLNLADEEYKELVLDEMDGDSLEKTGYSNERIIMSFFVLQDV